MNTLWLILRQLADCGTYFERSALENSLKMTKIPHCAAGNRIKILSFKAAHHE